MRAVAESAASLAGELEGSHNVLLLSPALGDEADVACRSLLSATPPRRADVLSVTFNQSPDVRLDRWRNAGGLAEPANLGFVVVGDRVRSATAAESPTDGPSPEDFGPTVTSVSSPGDLTGIGIELGSFFTDWAGDDNQLFLCFHTVTTFLQYAELRSVYRFLHVLTGRVTAAGGVGHYHLDPTAHDEQTVNTLVGLFDAVVEQGADGRWEVRRRR